MIPAAPSGRAIQSVAKHPGLARWCRQQGQVRAIQHRPLAIDQGEGVGPGVAVEQQAHRRVERGCAIRPRHQRGFELRHLPLHRSVAQVTESCV
jgi:hypothetical protein